MPAPLAEGGVSTWVEAPPSVKTLGRSQGMGLGNKREPLREGSRGTEKERPLRRGAFPIIHPLALHL